MGHSQLHLGFTTRGTGLLSRSKAGYDISAQTLLSWLRLLIFFFFSVLISAQLHNNLPLRGPVPAVSRPCKHCYYNCLTFVVVYVAVAECKCKCNRPASSQAQIVCSLRGLRRVVDLGWHFHLTGGFFAPILPGGVFVLMRVDLILFHPVYIHESNPDDVRIHNLHCSRRKCTHSVFHTQNKTVF